MKRLIPAYLLTMTMAAIAFTASAQTPATVVDNRFPKTITVSGSAEMEVVPDEIYVVVDLKEYEKKGQGKINLDKIKGDFLEACRQIGLPDSVISIASYDGYNGNPWLRKKNKKEELMASIAYQIKFKESRKMDELVDKLDDNATQNFRIVRTSHSKIQEYRKQLKIQAIKAAKEKAQYLAEAINEKVGEAVTITEPTDAFSDQPVYNMAFSNVTSQYRMKAGNQSGDDSGVDFKKIKLRFEVNTVFALKW
jgi:uncharacterized protein YggE